MDEDKAVTATFTEDCYTLAVTIVGSGSVAKNPDETCYAYDTVVTLTPTADPGWTFDGWSGADVADLVDVGGGNWTITMNSNKAVIATFVEDCDTPIANAGGDQCIQLDCASEVEVYFDGSGSSGTGLIYDWDFGDGSDIANDAGPNPSHIYSAGTYTVTLTVTDSCDNRVSDIVTITVHPPCDLPDTLTVSSLTLYSGHYLKVKFSGYSGDIGSGWYYGWCAHSDLIGLPKTGQQLHVYCTLDASLELADYWPKINWIVNNRTDYTRSQVQDAIWHYIHGKTVSGKALELVNKADDHGDFCPAIGKKFIVLLTPQEIDADIYEGIYRCITGEEQPILIEVVRVDHCG